MSVNEAVQHYQRAENLKQQGRFAEAETAYRAALNVDPKSPQLWWALGDLYARTENFPGVELCCRQILADNPGIPEVRMYLGMALQRQARLEDAEAELLGALSVNPGLDDARFQLGIVQQELGKDAQAIENYQTILDKLPKPAPALFNLSLLHERQGRADASLQYALRALQANPESRSYAQNFVRVLRAACPATADAAMRSQILRCFGMPGLDTAPLMRPCVALLSGDSGIQNAIVLAQQDDPRQFAAQYGRGVFDGLTGNELLQATLRHTKIAGPLMETLLCALRRLAVTAAIDAAAQMPEAAFRGNLAFAEALACQFFNNEYAAFVATEETAAIEALTERLKDDVGRGIPMEPALAMRVAIYCMYRPLHSLPCDAQSMDRLAGALAGVLPLIVERQWSAYQEEQRLREDMESLTAVAGGVSSAVREQYEEAPYPRWLSVDLYEPLSFRSFLGGQLPAFAPPSWSDHPIDALIAGCGTGRHAIMLASVLADSAFTAVDLSTSSLAYAKRKAEAAGLRNLRFAQADILELGSLGGRFHLVESIGVLHHMQDPLRGLSILSGTLVPGGLMRLGFYSALARRSVTAARQYIAERGFATTPDGIRAARKAMLALDTAHPAYPATLLRDFYTLSECRDLLFHVQEHCLTVPELSGMLEACGLRFLGFALDDTDTVARYRERFPDDSGMTDLATWHDYEQMYPDTFQAMYQLWCQKA